MCVVSKKTDLLNMTHCLCVGKLEIVYVFRQGQRTFCDFVSDSVLKWTLTVMVSDFSFCR